MTNYQQQQQQSLNPVQTSGHHSTNEMIQKQKQTIIKIYTDWANHYLKKRYHELAFSPTSSDDGAGTRIPGATRTSTTNNNNNGGQHYHHQQQRPVITSLVNDLHDGVLLIYLVESVTDSTIVAASSSSTSTAAYQTNLAPKNEDQMIANIETCLRFLNNLGVNINGIHAKDIHQGNLKSILTLFFNISRFKQNLKKQEATLGEENNGKSARFIKNNQNHHQHHHQYEPSSPNITSEDESGCLTDFSISSSTQSLLLASPTSLGHIHQQTSAAAAAPLFKQMTPPPTSSGMISRFSPSTGSHHHTGGGAGSSKSIHQQSNGASKLVQPTNNNNGSNGSSSSIPVPGSNNNGVINNNNVNVNPAKKQSSSVPTSSAKVSSSSLSINNHHHHNNNNSSQATPTNAAQSSSNNTGLPQINRSLAAGAGASGSGSSGGIVQNRHIAPPSSAAAAQRPTRPQSTSSIPQIGNLSTVVKPTVAVGLKKSSASATASSKSAQQKALPSTKSQDSGRRFINGVGGVGRLNPSQSELNLRRPSGTPTTNGTPTTIPAGKGGRFQLRRLPPPSSVGGTSSSTNNPLVNRRPISTIIESTTTSASSLPSASSSSSSSTSTSTTNMSMTTSCPTNCINMNNQQSSANLHSSLSSISKPMATVKAMVTPIMSTADSPNLKSDLKKSSHQADPKPERNKQGILRPKQTSRDGGGHQPHEPRSSSVTTKKSSITSSSSSSSGSGSASTSTSNLLLNRQDSNVTIQSGNSSDGNTSEDLEIPPSMEKPLQTISYLKSTTNNNTSSNHHPHHNPHHNPNPNSSNNVSNGHVGSRTTTPTIMFRKPENGQQPRSSGRSNYEPLYMNGPQQVPVMKQQQQQSQPQGGATTTTNLHRLSQGADYYGSDNSDSRQNPNVDTDLNDHPDDHDPAATPTTAPNSNQRSYEAKNHHLVVSDDPNTLINLHIPERVPRILRLKHSFSHPANGTTTNQNHLGFDETSSMSSDAGMVSGTDISATTSSTSTATTSCSSSNDRPRPKSSQNNRLLFKSSLADTSLQQHQLQPRLLSNSTTELYKSSSSSSIANNHHQHQNYHQQHQLHHNMGKLSTVGHSGTLPLNIGSAMMMDGPTFASTFNGGNFGKQLNGVGGIAQPMATPPPPPPPARCLANQQQQHRLLSKSSKFQRSNNPDPGSMVYSDSETLQSSQSQSSSRSTFSLFNNNNKFIGTNNGGQQCLTSNNKCFSVSSKDGSSSGYGELIYSNVNHHHHNHHQRHPSTDSESIDSLNTIGSSKSSLQQQHQHPTQHSIYSNGPTSGSGGSKPGDLICEYESVNRLRETMSASPTTTINGVNHHHQLHHNKISMNGIYSETNGVASGGGHLGRSGSFRLANGHHHHHHHLPPIPAHLNKIKEQQQQSSSTGAPQSEHSASSLSLLSSNSSSIFTTPEEKYIHEIRRLRRELDQANEKIYTLTSQLTANAHMVAAFEQSLSSMTTRLQQLSSNSELKDCELDRLRKTIDVLKKQGGSLVGHAKSATISPIFNHNNNNQHATSDKFQRYLSSESVNSVSSCDQNGGNAGQQQNNKLLLKKKSKLNKLTSGATNTSWIRSSFSRAFKKKSSSSSQKDSVRNRDAGGTVSDVETGVMNGGATGGGPQSESECGNFVHSVPNSPMLPKRNFHHTKSSHPRSMSESKASGHDNQEPEPEELKDLKKQLREKEMQLTDIRLESLTSAHQLENLKEIVNQMRMEMMNLKQDNDRLQRLVHHKSLASSQSSMTSAIGSHGSSTVPSIAVTSNGGGGGGGHSNSSGGILMPPMMTMMMMEDSNSFESVDMDNSPLHSSSMNDGHRLVTLGSGTHTLATLSLNAKTNWEQLDMLIKKSFKDHLIRVDGSLTLGITVDSLACYRVGAERVQRNLHAINTKTTTGQLLNNNNNNDDYSAPELLPFGYLVNENHINLQFKSTIDSLAFDTLTPKSVLQEFIEMLDENRRLIFAGPSGTGKTYLAHKLAEYMAIKHMDTTNAAVSSACSGLSPRNTPVFGDRSSSRPSGSIATFNVDHKNAKELRAYLTNIAEQCQMDVPVTQLPAVIILDNLHHSVDSLEDIFNDLHRISTAKSPYIIGTINQSVHHNQTTMKMFQHHSFHCIMLSVNSEAVKGYLNRFLRRKLLETEARLAMANNNQKLNPDIMKIIDWIPKVYGHLNKFLESYFGENISIGARLFTSCPIDLNGSQAWFTDLWNYSILPFIIENVREHVRQNGGRLPRSSQSKPSMISFIDPTDWIVANYPWQSNAEWSDHLNRLRPEDFEDDTSGGGGEAAKLVQNSLNSNTNNNNNNNSQETTRATSNNEQSTTTALLSMDSFEQSAKDIKDPFLQMLLKLKEASEYSSQECMLNETLDGGGDDDHHQSVQEI